MNARPLAILATMLLASSALAEPTTQAVRTNQGTYQTATTADQFITVTSTAQSLTVPNIPSSPATPYTTAIFSVTGGSLNYRTDGVAPTATVGMSLPAGLWTFTGPLSSFQFILPSGGSGVTLGVEYVR